MDSILKGVGASIGALGDAVGSAGRAADSARRLAGKSDNTSATRSIGAGSASSMRGRDVLNSNLGYAYIEIDGIRRLIFELQDISAVIEQRKEDVQLINDVMTKHKAVASNGSGSFTIYTGVPDYSTMISKYIKTHKGLYFTVTMTMDDPESRCGRRTVVLRDCLIDSHSLGRLSIESTVLNEEMGFTFDDYEIIEDFNAFNN